LVQRRKKGRPTASAQMKPPENWMPPSQMAMTSIGLSIWSVWVAAQVRRAPTMPASTIHMATR
jgi:hypothetical protein